MTVAPWLQLWFTIDFNHMVQVNEQSQFREVRRFEVAPPPVSVRSFRLVYFLSFLAHWSESFTTILLVVGTRRNIYIFLRRIVVGT